MTSDVIAEESDMNQQPPASEQHCTDIESYRKLVRSLLDLRRYKSALYWSEKVAVLSNNCPRDVYQLAHCMFMLKEFHRASHIIKRSGLEKTNLQCLALLVESLYASNDLQEALNLLTSLGIEELHTTLYDETEGNNSASLNPDTLRNVRGTACSLKIY